MQCAMQVQRLDRALALLRMVMDAKTETLTLIRSKLKEENSALKAPSCGPSCGPS